MINAKANNGKAVLIWAVEKGHTKIVKILLTAGADVNAKDNNDMTALNEAVIKKYPKITKMLIEHGADSGELFYSLFFKLDFKELFFLYDFHNFYNIWVLLVLACLFASWWRNSFK